ncbi:hypothetical protein JTE90_028470 [Oedothorax gibbosus]|uniref:Uncharacterized protein n=1 Tax=Oedothorax gibbosus TaxID=931172 RepID=A0AAV6VFE1_9ARAC|nr:hypothetical protein JTE90_028470 [Oedothorax gibbosus]
MFPRPLHSSLSHPTFANTKQRNKYLFPIQLHSALPHPTFTNTKGVGEERGRKDADDPTARGRPSSQGWRCCIGDRLLSSVPLTKAAPDPEIGHGRRQTAAQHSGGLSSQGKQSID